MRAMQKLETENSKIRDSRRVLHPASFKAEPRALIQSGLIEESTQAGQEGLTSQEDYSEALTYGGLSASDHAGWVGDVAQTPVGQFMHPVLLRGMKGAMSTPVKVRKFALGQQDRGTSPKRAPQQIKGGLARSSVETDGGMAMGDYVQMASEEVENALDDLKFREAYQKDGKTTRFGHAVNLAGWLAEKTGGNWLGKTGKVMDATSTLLDAKSAYNAASGDRLRELEKMDDETLCAHPHYKAVCDRLKEYSMEQRAAAVRHAEATQAGQEAFQKKLYAAGFAHLLDKATGRLNVPQTLRYFATALKEAGIDEIKEPMQSVRGLLGMDEEEE